MQCTAVSGCVEIQVLKAAKAASLVALIPFHPMCRYSYRLLAFMIKASPSNIAGENI